MSVGTSPSRHTRRFKPTHSPNRPRASPGDGGSSPCFVPRSNVFRSQNYSLDPKAQITLCRARGKRRQMPPIAKSIAAFEETGNV
jgi:hypothetical protein